MSLRLGRYETLQVIGTGGMATVHLARAVGEGGFERLVALKVMHPHIATDPDFVAMFLDEARLAARIRHPNVVPTLDVQRADGNLFLVMEYIEGLSLRALLRHLWREKMRVPQGVAVRIVLDMLSGLHAAHELQGPDEKPLNLVHRDVTPHNILVGVDGVTRLTDFGVARAEWRLSSTRGTSLKGKIAYMSSEQLMAENVDRRSDLYAAGVVLWEVLIGKRLFKAPSDGALVAAVLKGADRSPRQVNPDVPLAIDRVCMKALSLDPAARYPTAMEFLEALEDAAHDDGVRIATSRAVASFVKDTSERIKEAPASQVSISSEVSEREGGPLPAAGTAPTASQSASGSRSASGVGNAGAIPRPAVKVLPPPPDSASGLTPSQKTGPPLPDDEIPTLEKGGGKTEKMAVIEAEPTEDGGTMPTMPLAYLDHAEPLSESSHSSTKTEAVLPSAAADFDDDIVVGPRPLPPKVLYGAAAATALVVILVVVSLMGGGESTSPAPAAGAASEAAMPSERTPTPAPTPEPSEAAPPPSAPATHPEPVVSSQPKSKPTPKPAPQTVPKPTPRPAPVVRPRPRPSPRPTPKPDPGPFQTDQL